MKTFNKYFIGIFALFFALSSCNEGIDPITAVDPGPDTGSPVINVSKPTEGFEIQVPEPITSVNIEFKVQDDIEVSLITVKIDGNVIATYDNFIDFRIVNKKLLFDQVATGPHVLTIEAKDIAGNITTSNTNFTKAPPYTPLFVGETFYMNFDGSFQDLITNKDAKEVGSPGFTTDAQVGKNAYKGATDSYLTFPTSGLLGTEFSASFWYKLNATPNRSGILTIAPEDPTNPTALIIVNLDYGFLEKEVLRKVLN